MAIAASLLHNGAMPIPLAVAVYITIWFTVLFAVLPIGVRSQDEEGAVIPGTEPGAPAAPRLLVKALATTLLSALLLALLLAYMHWTE